MMLMDMIGVMIMMGMVNMMMMTMKRAKKVNGRMKLKTLMMMMKEIRHCTVMMMMAMCPTIVYLIF